MTRTERESDFEEKQNDRSKCGTKILRIQAPRINMSAEQTEMGKKIFSKYKPKCNVKRKNVKYFSVQ